MNIRIIRSVQRRRKAWEGWMLQRFVYPLGLLWARPNCSQSPVPSSPLLAPSVKHPMYRALAGSEDATWSLLLSLLNSQISHLLLFAILISKFSGFVFLLRMMDSKQQSSFKNNQEVQTCLHTVSIIIKTLYHTTEINEAYTWRHITADDSNFCVILEYSFTFWLAQSIHVSLWYILIQKQKQGNTKDGDIFPYIQF